jgi:hypothetical protein
VAQRGDQRCAKYVSQFLSVHTSGPLKFRFAAVVISKIKPNSQK